MMDPMVIVARSERDRLGEGPIWLADSNEVAWVDIVGGLVHRRHLDTGTIRTLAVGEPVGWILPRAGHAEVIVGLRSGIYILDIDTGARALIIAPEPDRPNNRLNDAKVDAQGRIWAGSKDDTDQAASGALYRLTGDGACTRMDDRYGVTNGPTFSLDGATMYHTDSAARTVYTFTLDPSGNLHNKRVWLRFEDSWGYPDGMTTDADGCIWIAHWGGGAVSRFDPDGRRIRSVSLPATNITSCCFAGDALDQLFVTSSTIGCESEPEAGALFRLDVGVRGIAPNRFAG